MVFIVALSATAAVEVFRKMRLSSSVPFSPHKWWRRGRCGGGGYSDADGLSLDRVLGDRAAFGVVALLQGSSQQPVASGGMGAPGCGLGCRSG
jgi:hypothetical protein